MEDQTKTYLEKLQQPIVRENISITEEYFLNKKNGLPPRKSSLGRGLMIGQSMSIKISFFVNIGRKRNYKVQFTKE